MFEEKDKRAPRRAAVWGSATLVLSSVREGLNTNPFELLIRDAPSYRRRRSW